MEINQEFNISQIVYVKTDIDQLRRIVTGFQIRLNGSVTYIVCYDGIEKYFFGYEISDKKDENYFKECGVFRT